MSEWSKITSVPESHAFLRDHLARTWNDGPALSIQIEQFRPAYDVEGRRRNGSVKGQNAIRWFFGRILLPVRNTLLVPVSFLSGTAPSSGWRTSKVTGPGTSMAVAFARLEGWEVEHAAQLPPG